jgi:hypothetical protein
MASRPWNWNIHYQRVVLDALPSDAATALDVGSGDGLLAFDLAARGLDVIVRRRSPIGPEWLWVVSSRMA